MEPIPVRVASFLYVQPLHVDDIDRDIIVLVSKHKYGGLVKPEVSVARGLVFQREHLAWTFYPGGVLDELWDVGFIHLPDVVMETLVIKQEDSLMLFY